MSKRELIIKTGIVKRIGKELLAYEQELKTQQSRIDKLKSNNADEHDIRKQYEVLKETQDIFPDCKKRLLSSAQELKELLALLDKNEELVQEITNARQVLENPLIALDSI